MEHLPSIVVAVIVLGAFLAVIVRGILRKKAGKSGCSGCCDNCASKGFCKPSDQ